MEGVWPQLEGLLTRRGGCTYLSHGTSEFRASICFMNYFDTVVFFPVSCLFILFHHVLMHIDRGCGVKCLPHQVGVRLFPFCNARTGSSPPGDPFLQLGGVNSRAE